MSYDVKFKPCRARHAAATVATMAAAWVCLAVTPAHAQTIGPTPIERVSLTSAGGQSDGHSGGSPDVSADGRYVAFGSLADDLVAGDNNGKVDVFVRDRQTGVTERVSVSTRGEQADGYSWDPAISADGRDVAFVSDAPNLVPDDTNQDADIFVHDRSTGTTERVSVDSRGAEGTGRSGQPSISADGRYVAFGSDSVWEPGDTDSPGGVYVRDRRRGVTERIVAPVVAASSYGESSPSISADGRYVAFTGDHALGSDVFVRDRTAGTTQRVSVDSAGRWMFTYSALPAITPDGRFIEFSSAASDPTAGEIRAQNIFVHDRQSGAVELVGAGAGDQGAHDASISADGRYVAFASIADNLVPDDTNDTDDVFVRDRQTATTYRVSTSATDAQANGTSAQPAISQDGRTVVFASIASNLVDDDTNATYDVFARSWQPNPPPPAPTCPGESYHTAVRCDHPGAYWRLEERVGTIAVDEIQAAPARRHGGSPGQPAAPVSDSTAALGLNLAARSQHEHLQAGNLFAFPGRHPFTLEAWIKPLDLTDQTARIVSKEDNGHAGYLLGLDTRGLVFSRYTPTGAQTVTAPITAGRWSHIAASYDGNTMRLYLDGHLVAARTSTAILPDLAVPLHIASKSGLWRFYAGWLDDIAIYPTALSSDAIARHHATAT